jgi:hypothetical protein
MQEEPQVLVESDGDALADSAQLPYDPPLGERQRRLGSAQQKGTPQTDTLESLVEETTLERDEVSGDVGQLGHGTDHASELKILSSAPTCRGMP